MVESEKNSATASSFPTALRTLPEHMSNGQSPGIECDVDSEAIAKAYKKELVERMDLFWGRQMREMEDLDLGREQDFKNHNDLPLARIKRIMKSDEDVRMISAEAPVLFAKACEMFILEMSVRSWCYAEQSRRRTLQKEDIHVVLQLTEEFDFLNALQIMNLEQQRSNAAGGLENGN